MNSFVVVVSQSATFFARRTSNHPGALAFSHLYSSAVVHFVISGGGVRETEKTLGT